MYTSKRVIRPNNEVVRYYCDNGYGLSVACHEHSYGGKEGLYEIALLKDDKISVQPSELLYRLPFSAEIASKYFFLIHFII